ncbi:MAG: hypothetical protein HY069_04000, partial [Chlamydiia bacterium]|nr:hypothetical protein [Chlamydiia bacterium]
MEPFEEQQVTVLKCNHVFHTLCVQQWLDTGHNNCPQCRQENVDNRPLSGRVLAALGRMSK